MMDQTMDPVKAQAMELEKDLGQVKILRNNNLHHGYKLGQNLHIDN